MIVKCRKKKLNKL